jgi:hypothetical protein
MPSRLQKALRKGLAPGGNLADELFRLGEYVIADEDDAREVCEALKQFPLPASPQDDFFQGWTPLHAVTALFQQIDNDSVFAVLFEHGIPELIRVFDALLDRAADDDSGGDDVDAGEPASTARRGDADALLFVLKILVMYQSSDGMARVVEAARLPLKPESYLWSVVFEQFDQAQSFLPWLFKELSRPLPTGFIAVALLDCANQALIAGHVDEHPFDTPTGRKRLEAWLTSDDRGDHSYAVSAAAALPFIRKPHRERLLALALDHTDPKVQLEAAWASATIGSAAGVKYLRRLCLSPATSASACSYLRELGRDDLIPKEAMEPQFLAMVDLCTWLAGSSDYGRVPDHIELRDTRELVWPPTGDRRRVWLFRFIYYADVSDSASGGPAYKTPADGDQVGIGMVGSVTYVLRGETTPDQPPLDVYALHCCWELQVNKDPRAPSERSVHAGRSILAEYNPEQQD